MARLLGLRGVPPRPLSPGRGRVAPPPPPKDLREANRLHDTLLVFEAQFLLRFYSIFLFLGLTPRGINGLCQSLRSSPKILETLTHLNLSGNWIRGDEAEVEVKLIRNY